MLNCLVASVGHQSHEAGDLDRIGHASLVFVAQACALGWLDFELGANKLAQEGYVFVVYLCDGFFVNNGSFH